MGAKPLHGLGGGRREFPTLESKARVKAFAQRAIGLRTTGLIWRGLSRTRGDNLHREDQRRTRGLGIQLRDRLVVASVGGIALLIAANAVPTISAVPAAPAMTRKPDALRSIVAVPSNLTTDPRKIQGSDQPLGRASGFRVIAGPSVQPLSMSPPTVSVMMTVTNPMALAHAEYDATSATVEGAAPSARPKVRTKLKHKPPKQEPQPLPWLRQQQ